MGYARQVNARAYPVKAPKSDLKFSELPHWMKKAHSYDKARAGHKVERSLLSTRRPPTYSDLIRQETA